MPSEPTLKRLREFFAEESEVGRPLVTRCVVTGDRDHDWHHLDDNHGNDDVGNIIPLAPRLNQYLGGLKNTPKSKPSELFHEQMRLPILALKAELHLSNWRLASAIGCLRLAYYLSRSPYQDVDTNSQLKAAIEPIRYLRHRVEYGILNTTLRDVLSELKSVGHAPESVIFPLQYDLIALLNEHGEHLRASVCAQQLHVSFAATLDDSLPPDKVGSILRRILQVAQMDSDHFPFAELQGVLDERAEDSLRLRTSIANTNVLDALTSQDKTALAHAYELIDELCHSFSETMRRGRKPGVGLSDLAEAFMYRAILAQLLRPRNYRSIVEESCETSRNIFRDCHALVTYQYPMFWIDVFKLLKIDPNSDHLIARLYQDHDRTAMSDLDRADEIERTSELIDEIFDAVSRIVLTKDG